VQNSVATGRLLPAACRRVRALQDDLLSFLRLRHAPPRTGRQCARERGQEVPLPCRHAIPSNVRLRCGLAAARSLAQIACRVQLQNEVEPLQLLHVADFLYAEASQDMKKRLPRFGWRNIVSKGQTIPRVTACAAALRAWIAAFAMPPEAARGQREICSTSRRTRSHRCGDTRRVETDSSTG
jgi:hypothetical protein